MAGSHNHYASASLYVGDLAPEVNETMLFEIFNAIGPVASIRVCRESGSRKSLGYAYVNYHSVHDAERALDTLNFTPVKGIPCRIMWSHRDPSLRKSGAGNIFVKDLDKSIDNKSLFDTFSLFGNILSCKVATDDYGKSRGYGFVHYETEEAAKLAMEKVNGMLIGTKNVYVGPFKKRGERADTRSENYTNLYVKHFPDTWTEETLRSLFSPFGTITSSAINTDGKGRRFGFVNLETPDSAKAAVTALHDRRTTPDGVAPVDDAEKAEKKDEKKPVDEQVNGEGAVKTEESSTADVPKGAKVVKDEVPEDRLYVQRAMTRSERMSLLKESFTSATESKQKLQGVNLYIKNLDDQVGDEGLREAFSKFGTVTSAKVMRDEANVSKGFGFVCFAFPEDATKAVTAMHLKLFHGKPLYVGLAEKRDQRVARLQQRYRMSNVRPMGLMMMGPMAGPMGPMPYGQSPAFFGSGGSVHQRPMAGPGSYGGPAGAGGPMNMAWRQGPRPHGPGMQGGPAPGAMGPQMTTPSYPYAMGPVGPMNPPPGAVMRGGMGGGPHPRGGPGGMGGSMGHPPNFKFTPQARNRQDFPPHVQPQALPPHQHFVNDPMLLGGSSAAEVPLSAQSLAAAHPHMQKQMLGEKLFPLVSKHQPELAGKITGMMLEMDNAELLSLLESETQLQAKVDEALGVLHRHQAVPMPGGGVPAGVSVAAGLQ